MWLVIHASSNLAKEQRDMEQIMWTYSSDTMMCLLCIRDISYEIPFSRLLALTITIAQACIICLGVLICTYV